METQPFVIVGTQRTGSSFVATTLNTHPEINCGWEWALDVTPIAKISTIHAGLHGHFDQLPESHRVRMSSVKKDAKVIGFRLLFSSSPKWIVSPKLNLPHWVERLNGFLKYFCSNPNIKILHIVRSNNLAWLTSLFLAKTSKLYIDHKYPDDLKIEVPLGEAEKRVKAKLELEKKLRLLGTSNPFLEKKYEDLIQDKSGEFKKIFEFLGVSAMEDMVKSPTKKQLRRPLSEVVSNYDELKDVVSEIELNYKNIGK